MSRFRYNRVPYKQCFSKFNNVHRNHPGSCPNAGSTSVDLERGPKACISNEVPQSTLGVTRPQKIVQVPKKDDQE